MSLWYQTPQSTFEPRDSRSIGWSQVSNRKAVLLPDDAQSQSPQHSTGGGTQLDLSNTLRFGAPTTNIELDPTINFAQFGFQNFQDLTVAQYQMISNQSFTEVINQINYFSTQATDYEARIAEIEAWRATGSTACDGGTVVAMEDWYYDDVNEIIQKVRSTFRIQEGLITSFDGSVDPISSCPGGTPNGNEPISTCPPP